MNQMILDTSYLIDYLRGKPFSNLDVVRGTSIKKGVHYNGIILTEILSNVRSKRDKSNIDEMIFGLVYLPLRFSDFILAGEIRNNLFNQGFSMGTADALIAAHAKEHDLTVVTMDSFFLKAGDLIGIKVEIPTIV